MTNDDEMTEIFMTIASHDINKAVEALIQAIGISIDKEEEDQKAVLLDVWLKMLPQISSEENERIHEVIFEKASVKTNMDTDKTLKITSFFKKATKE